MKSSTQLVGTYENGGFSNQKIEEDDDDRKHPPNVWSQVNRISIFDTQ